MAATAATFAPSAINSEGGPLTPIALIFDSLTFDKRQTRWLKDLERTVSHRDSGLHCVHAKWCVLCRYLWYFSRASLVQFLTYIPRGKHTRNGWCTEVWHIAVASLG